MRKKLTFLFLFSVFFAQAQKHQAFEAGEWFEFRIHYGVFNASFATLEVKEEKLNQKPVYHIVGHGESTGLLDFFFKVDDNYETYIDKRTGQPYRFIRKINEGGHTKDIQIDFNHANNTALVHNKKYNEKTTFSVEENVQDMLSSFYYLRNHLDVSNLSPGDITNLNMFFDNENFDFRVKFLGREVLDTKLGKIATLKFRPYVMAGRVFKEKESLTFWVSDDANRMPVKIEADLAVGSLEADINAFKGLKHPLKIIMD
ncbi:MAG TPA: DUF3108 domain-containing protein [Salinimicrobium sp.]|nr:DUF3108 domain-containing protein [Salinimicrobium sp.]